MRYNHVFIISEVKMASHSASCARCGEAISKPLVFILESTIKKDHAYYIVWGAQVKHLYNINYWYQTFQSASIKVSDFILLS